jgi:hypothetical protein
MVEERANSSSRNRLALMLAVAFSGLVLFWIARFFIIDASVSRQHHEAREADVRQSQKYLNEQLAEVRSGRTKSISLYCSVGTDRLLRQLVNVPGIEEVKLNLTDATDDGMKSLAALKKLKSLALHGSLVGDLGFSYLTVLPDLEHLELTNTQVTDRSLPSFKRFRKLQRLALYHETRLGPTFTEAGMVDLKALVGLKQLYLCGGWASAAAIRELKKALPDCRISTDEGDLVF